MHKQQIISVLVLLILIAGLSLVFFKDRTPIFEETPTTNEDGLTDGEDTETPGQDILIQEETEEYSINVTYRSDMPQEVQIFITNAVVEFKSYNRGDMVMPAPFIFDLSVDTYQSGDYTSYAVTYYSYTGGANGNGFVKTFVYYQGNLVTREQVVTDKEVRQKVQAELQQKFGESLFQDALASPQVLDNFYLTDDTVVFLFSEYDVVPGVFGDVSVVINRDTIDVAEIPEKVVEGTTSTPIVTDFFSCINVTGEILESYPRQCIFGGKSFVEQIKEIIPDGDGIEIDVTVGPERVPCTGTEQKECLVVDGSVFYDEIAGFDHVPGTTYSLRIKRTLAFGTADPKEIPADASLYAFELVTILGSIEKDESIDRCVVAGCSSQLCISQDEYEKTGGVSTCEYKDEYQCYKLTTCETQISGECGWTETPEFNQCFADPEEQQ